MLSVICPAKVNLHLGIGPLRDDGYHDLVSVFHALALADELTFQPADALSLSCEPPVGVPESANIAYQAAVAMGVAFDRDPAYTIRLTKHIPHGAGLGGGSSDAAGVIAGLAHLWDVDCREDRALHVARSLGADVAFFLTGGAALMTGRGDVVARQLPALDGTPLVLVRPPMLVSTAEAYREFDRAPVPAEDPAAMVAALEAGDAQAVASALSNNLEAASLAVVPQVGEVLSWVSAHQAVTGALVAGSGSTVFGLTRTAHECEMIAAEASTRGWWSCSTRLVAHGAQIAARELSE